MAPCVTITRGFLLHLAHKDPNVTVCAAAGLRLLVSHGNHAAALALGVDAAQALIDLDIEHTHPHARVEVARTLAAVLRAAAQAAAATSPGTRGLPPRATSRQHAQPNLKPEPGGVAWVGCVRDHDGSCALGGGRGCAAVHGGSYCCHQLLAAV